MWISPLSVSILSLDSGFFMYLYQDLNRRFQPLMVIGQPLLTPWAHQGSIFLTGYFLAFTGIVSKVPGMFQSGSFLWFLMSSQSTLWAYENTDLKHLTLKTAFLIALGSGKHRCEIHAWVANKVYNLGQWEKEVLFPSSDFIAHNIRALVASKYFYGGFQWTKSCKLVTGNLTTLLQFFT